MEGILLDLALATVLLVLLLLAFEIGYRVGLRNVADQDPRAGGQIGAVQGAVLGLLGLLLAFSFSAAGSRFLERQDLIVQEANAIGTAALRADLLAEPYRSQMRDSLRDYAAHRLRIQSHLRRAPPPGALAEVERAHAAIWSTAIAGVQDRPHAMLGVLPPVNEVIDLHAVRLAAGRKHLPALVVGVLIGCSLLALGSMGYGAGISGHRRRAMTLPLTILIGVALWITIDLDHPRAGLLRLNDAPLRELRIDRAPEAGDPYARQHAGGQTCATPPVQSHTYPPIQGGQQRL